MKEANDANPMSQDRAGPRWVVYGGGGGTSSQRLETSDASRERGESMRGGGTPRLLEGGLGEFLWETFKNLCL